MSEWVKLILVELITQLQKCQDQGITIKIISRKRFSQSPGNVTFFQCSRFGLIRKRATLSGNFWCNKVILYEQSSQFRELQYNLGHNGWGRGWIQPHLQIFFKFCLILLNQQVQNCLNYHVCPSLSFNVSCFMHYPVCAETVPPFPQSSACVT